MAVSNRVWRSVYISIAIILSSAGLAQATTVIMPTDTQLMIESRAIVRAKVKSVSTGLDEQSGIVYTYIKLKVTDVFKGDIRDSVIVLKQPGGATAERGTVINSAPRFTAGERVIVFLHTMSDGTLQVHDAFLGKYSIIKDAASGNQIVVRGAAQGAVNIVPQTSDSTDKMELGAYLAKLRAGLSANMQKSLEFADQYYARAPMLSLPPEYEDKARSGGIQPEFHLFSPPARWFQPDSNQPVTILINSAGAPSGFQADVDAAMGAWSNVTGCSLRVVDGGATANCPGASGVSVAEFSNCMGFFSSSGGSCQSVLAEGGFNYTTGSTKVVSGTSFYQITSGFISFNPFAACSFTSACNVEEITTHEMGHSLGLAHSWDPSFGGSATAVQQAATMYYIAHFDGRCASIMSDDVSGITFVYPATSTAPNYVGYIDHAGCDVIGGWAADKNRLNTSINVEIYDGTTLISTVLANSSRADVGAFLGDNGLHGFSVTTPASLKNGATHSVHVKFETSATELSGSPAPISCSGSSTNYTGFIDHAGCDSILGWAADRNRLNTSINVEIYDGSTLVAIVPANLSRGDVGSFLGDNGLHGFSITTPASLRSGSAHSVHLKFETSTTELSGSPASLNCATFTPNYIGYLDHIACDSIYGWVADRNRLNTPITVSIYANGVLIDTVQANASRSDVGGFLGDNGLHGFVIATTASMKGGKTTTVNVRFETSGTDLFSNSPVTLTCP
jgi:hypothetical protein